MPTKPKPVKPIKDHLPARPKLTTAQRDYGTNHERWRVQVLRDHPICQYRGEQCTMFSQEAHHLTRPASGPEDYLAVCVRCHQEITRRERDAL